MRSLHALDRYRDHGLLALRLGIGAMFVAHGLPKLLGGAEAWTRLGAATAALGLDFAPTFWGLMAALGETVGGLMLALGLLTRVACGAFLVPTMIVAAVLHLDRGDGFARASHAIESGILFASLLLIGPGRFSLDHRLFADAGGGADNSADDGADNSADDGADNSADDGAADRAP